MTLHRTACSLAVAAVALALTAGVAPVSAQTAAPPPFPKDMPRFGADPVLPAPQVSRHRLPNGLQVWVVPRQGLPRVDAMLAIRGAGQAADGPQQAGFSALLADLLSEGTQRRDARTLAQDVQALGGSLGAAATADGITVGLQALASQAGPMLQLLAEVVREPAFADAEVLLARNNALEGLKVASAQPGFRAEGALGPALFGSHPYARGQATEAGLMSATPEALRRAHAQRFRPERALLVVAGRISAAEGLALARAAFGSWQAVGEALPDAPPAPRQATPVRVLIERPGSVQTTLRLGRPAVPATDADAVPLRVAGAVLGDGFTSRINMNLREEKGYTYGASLRSGTLRDGGAIRGGADVRNEVTGAALQEIQREMRRLQTEPVPAQELAETQRYLSGSYLVGLQTQSALVGTLARNWVVGLPPEQLVNYTKAVHRVTAAQVQAVAKTYFAPEAYSWVVVGDAAVAPQLQPFGRFETLKP
jgi:predicted Zn-dependent peptidase